MAVTPRAKRIASGKAQAYGARRMADILSRRAMIEGSIKSRELEAKSDLEKAGVSAIQTVVEFGRDYQIAQVGGFKGTVIDYLRKPEEASVALRRGRIARASGENIIYDPKIGEYVDKTSPIPEVSSNISEESVLDSEIARLEGRSQNLSMREALPIPSEADADLANVTNPLGSIFSILRNEDNLTDALEQRRVRRFLQTNPIRGIVK